MFYSDIADLEEKNRVQSGLAVIAQLKQTYQKPVITMTGWPPSEDTWTQENTKQAGADFLFFLPLEGELFRNAVNKCWKEEALAYQIDYEKTTVAGTISRRVAGRRYPC